ncbi:unnamed protein product, partial [Rotaria sp. Silwood2]
MGCATSQDEKRQKE